MTYMPDDPEGGDAASSSLMRVSAGQLRALTLKELSDSPRLCDGCGSTTLFGCVGWLTVSFSRFELCSDCWDTLKASIK